MQNRQNKPVIGISSGDLNGIGIELIIKTFSDSRILEFCTPVIFASNKVINFYKKNLPDYNLSFQILKDIARPFPKQVNIVNCWEEDVNITPGQQTEIGGSYAVKSLTAAVEAFKAGHINGLVTAPLHKNNVQSEEFKYTGHTPYLKDAFGANEVLMLMCADNMRVGLLTEHVPVKDVAPLVTKQAIMKKIIVMRDSLQRDFGIDKPRIAVLGLNPHSGDDGLIGKEEEEQIKPAIKEARNNNILAFGPYSADAFFARGQHEKFDAVLAMYHDQGLIPFKSLANGEGINFTAGIPLVRTSPDHGTAFDIAGKSKADEASFRHSVFFSIEVLEQRAEHANNRSNPLKRMSVSMLRNAEDEKIEEESAK